MLPLSVNTPGLYMNSHTNAQQVPEADTTLTRMIRGTQANRHCGTCYQPLLPQLNSSPRKASLLAAEVIVQSGSMYLAEVLP